MPQPFKKWFQSWRGRNPRFGALASAHDLVLEFMQAAYEAGAGKSRVSGGRGAKAKGSDFERELAEYLNAAAGLESRRALLSGGGRNDGGADLDGTPLIHVEAKRVEKVSPYEHMRQAETAIGKARDKTVKPVIITRKNNMETGQSLVIMRLDDWLQLYAAKLREDAGRSTPEPLRAVGGR